MKKTHENTICKHDLCEGGSFSTAIFSSDIQLRFSTQACVCVWCVSCAPYARALWGRVLLVLLSLYSALSSVPFKTVSKRSENPMHAPPTEPQARRCGDVY